MSNENQNKSGTSKAHTKDSERSTLREFGGFVKNKLLIPGAAGATGILIASGGKAVFNRFAQRSTENAVSSGVHASGAKPKPF